jgi:hypothetical protein
MAYSEGSKTYFAYKAETTANTEESGSGGTVLRRVSGTLGLTKAEVTSAEKRDDFQEVNVLHGSRQAPWSINGELYGNDYAAFLEAIFRRNFAAVTQITGAFTISSGVLTRASGNFVTDGLKVGHVVRLGSMSTTANLARNLRVTALTTTTATLEALDGGAAVANDSGPNNSATMDIPGKVTFIPSTGHTSKTFTIEKHDLSSDTSQVSRGCKVGTLEISVQPDQPPSISFSGLGVDRRNVASGAAPLLTSPTAAGTGAAMSAGIGYVRANGAALAAITGLTLTMDNGISGVPVAFDNTTPDVFQGRTAQVTFQLSALKTGNTLSGLYDAETELALEFYIAAPGSDPNAFVSIYMGRTKFNAVDEDDPDGAVTETISGRALKRLSGTGQELTTIMIQDSSVS